MQPFYGNGGLFCFPPKPLPKRSPQESKTNIREVFKEADRALSLQRFHSFPRKADVAKGVDNLSLRGDREGVVLVRSPLANAGVAPHDGAPALRWDQEAHCL